MHLPRNHRILFVHVSVGLLVGISLFGFTKAQSLSPPPSVTLKVRAAYPSGDGRDGDRKWVLNTSLPIGTTVGQVYYSVNSREGKARVRNTTYSLTAADKRLLEYFEVDRSSGIITIRRSLETEEKNSFVLKAGLTMPGEAPLSHEVHVELLRDAEQLVFSSLPNVKPVFHNVTTHYGYSAPGGGPTVPPTPTTTSFTFATYPVGYGTKDPVPLVIGEADPHAKKPDWVSSSNYGWIAAIVLGVLLVAFVIFFIVRMRRRQHRKKRLGDKEKEQINKTMSGTSVETTETIAVEYKAEMTGKKPLQAQLSNYRYLNRRKSATSLSLAHSVSGPVMALDGYLQPSLPILEDERWEFPRANVAISELIGEGCFGQVFRAQAFEPTGATIVAVKTLKQNAGEKEKQDLINELQLMKTLDPHPNVVELLGCCTEQDPILVIMEYAALGKLQSYLRRSRDSHYYGILKETSPLTPKDLTSFAYQVARGMEFLSGKGILHRDLAARNILLTEERICKVSDFGLARDVIDEHIYERKSEGRLPIRWMAPESLYDSIFTTKSDVWSFGVLMWEIVTLGSTPYPGMSAADVMRKIKEGTRLERPEHCKRELFNVMYYCWHEDPTERPSFGELVERLDQLLAADQDYLDLKEFPENSYYNTIMTNVSGEKV